MFIFFDETFRESLSNPGSTFGALCGIAIPEKDLHRLATDIFQLKLKHFGSVFARDGEIKGRSLLSNRIFKFAKSGSKPVQLAFADDLCIIWNASTSPYSAAFVSISIKDSDVMT